MRDETREAWRGRVERWQRSGLNAGQFAAREAVRPQTLLWWRWRLTRDRREAGKPTRRTSPAAPPVGFVELVAAPPHRRDEEASRALELVVGRGYRVRVTAGFDGDVLERLLDLLEARR